MLETVGRDEWQPRRLSTEERRRRERTRRRRIGLLGAGLFALGVAGLWLGW